MPSRRPRALIYPLIAIGLVPFVSCDGNNPTGPTPRPPTPPPGSTVTTVQLEVEAPPSVAPGASAQLKAQAVRSDGSRQDVSGQAQWTSSNTALLQVGADGVATGRARGEARITARHEGRSAVATIFVLPDGTFRLRGQIMESGLGVSGARVEVIEGTGTGLIATSGFDGGYALYGVAGPITLHLKKAGYHNGIHRATVDSHATLSLDMALERPRVPLAGSYALTISAGSCASALPDAARRRTYDATIEQRGAELTVRLSGADFILTNGRGSSFTGTYLAGDRLNFRIGESSYYYYYYFRNTQEDLVERLNDSTAFIVNGDVAASVESGSIIPGTLSGTIGTSLRSTWPFWPYTTSCVTSSHRFELRRR